MFFRARLSVPLLLAAGLAGAEPLSPLLADKYAAFRPGDDENRLTLGVLANDRQSFKLGEYSGVRDDDVYGVAGFFADGVFDNSDIRYRFEADNLGLDSRQLLGELGFAGGIGLEFSYREIPHYDAEGVLTPYLRTGDNRWTLPSDWVAAPGVSGFSALDGNLWQTDTHTKREQWSAALQLPLGRRWQASGEYRLEKKTGNQLTGVVFGVGGTQLGVRIPTEIDRQSQDIALALTYNGDRGTFTGGYRFHDLDEDSDPLVVQNPFVNSAFADAANYPTGFGRVAPAPDSSAQTFYGKGVLRLWGNTRLSVDLRRSEHRQDEDFLPFTINGGLDTPVPLPIDDLDGERVITHGKVSLTGRPTRRLHLALSYRYHDRDNDTDRWAFAQVLHDILDQGTDPATGDVRVNRPFSRLSRQWDLEARYRVASGWTLSGGVGRETIERDFLPVDDTDEDSAFIKVDYRLTPSLTGWLKAFRSERDSGSYQSNAAYLAGHTQAFVEAQGEDAFVNDPALRQFFIADRERERWDWALNWAAGADTGFALNAAHTDDSYDDSDFGLTDAEHGHVTLDVTHRAGSALDIYGYASRAWREGEQGGFQWLGFQPQSVLPPNRDNSARGWRVESESRSDTFGLGVEWQASAKLAFNLEWALTQSDTEYDFRAGSLLSAAPLPDLTMDWRDVTARVRYQLRERVTLAVDYRHRDYSTHDFALDGVAPSTDPSVLLSGADAPDFRSNTLVFSVTYGIPDAQ